VLESCEHFRSFMNYKPEIIIITNIEVDHLDYYKNLEDYVSAFRSFIKKLPKKGLLIANGDDANVKKIIKNFRGAKVILYGESAGNDYKLGGGAVKTPQNKKITLNLKIPGRHNLLNAAAVITLACELKLDPETANKALSSFQGSARRCELKGIIGRTHVIDDYAHHPTEIRATLRAMREKYGTRSRILCIFQPHQYSRTRLLLKDFAASFKDADEVIIPNILGVRDKPADIKKMTPEKLVKEISKNHPRASHINGFPETSAYVKKRLKNYDVVITMGAGDVWKIADEIIR
jgi:UDP-N-acetylmuramate--alanine ligase